MSEFGDREEPGAGKQAGDVWATPGEAQPGEAPATGPRRRMGLVVGAVALVVIAVAATIGVFAVTGGNSNVPGSGVAPADFVVSSTQNTFAHHTADVTIAGSVSAAGQDVPITGTGSANFDDNEFTADITVAPGSHSIVEHEITTGGHLYLGMTIDGQDISRFTGGPHWIDVPVPDQNSSALGVGSVDPMGQLQLLAKKGATVTPLGTSTVDGVTVSGYSVVISQAEEQQNLQQEIQSGAIPQSLVPTMQEELQKLGTPTIDVYIDGSDLLRQVSFGAGGASSGVSTKVTMTFGNFGTPVSISPPANDDVISFTQFLQAAQAAIGSSGSGG